MAMPKIYKHWSFWLHVGQLALTIGFIYGTTLSTLNAHAAQLAELKDENIDNEEKQMQRIEKIRDDMVSVKVDVSAIKSSVNDIKDALNIRHRDDRR